MTVNWDWLPREIARQGVGMAARDVHRDAIDEPLRQRFTSAWVEGHPEPIEQFLPAEEDPKYLATLEELVRAELELAWKSWSESEQRQSTTPPAETVSRPASVENYLKRFPRLDQPETVLRLLQEEYSARKQCGQPASIEEYRRRFPELAIGGRQFESGLPMVSRCSDDGRLADTMAFSPSGGGAAMGTAPGRFGNYELLEEIGRGGMGIVYRARQLTADRIVALKVIRRDRLESLPRDTKTSALDRFRQEAQAAARLEHENIVTVYEVGDVDGQPFFSMQYVEGRSLAEIVREGPIENRRAARYMEPVARAVHEAHSQGILHRDLKPQNIPVDSKTDRALVADFGLAKLAEGNEELTREGEVMGTPSYMSPEQAKDSAHVTAQTDVYALGATLYHVLTGRAPFHAATAVETLRQVIDEEPAPPRQVNASIDRDLETICLKCLQKEPSRRYDSAEVLADDLRRYLEGIPILARPVGTVERTWRWCRRNPALATSVTLAATFLVVALVVTAVAYVQTRAALTATKAAQEQERKTVDKFFTDVSQETLLHQPGLQPLRQKLLRNALDQYQQLLSQRGDEPGIRDELALAHFRAGGIAEEIDSPRQALAAYGRARQMQQQILSERPDDRLRLQQLGNTLNAIGRVWHKLGKLDYAREAYREATTVRKRLVQAAPEECEFRRALANAYMNIGNLEKDSNDFVEARRQYQRAQTVRRELLDQRGEDPKVRCDLGMGYYNLAILAITDNQSRDAQQNLEDAIATFEKLLGDDPGNLANQARLAICYRTLADLKCSEDTAAAKELYQKALARQTTLARKNPAVPDYQADLARLHMVLGQLEAEQEGPLAATESFRQAARLLEVLVEDYADVPGYRFDCAVALEALGRLQGAAGEYQDARDHLEAAEQHLGKLLEKSPDNPDFRSQLRSTTSALDELDALQPREE